MKRVVAKVPAAAFFFCLIAPCAGCIVLCVWRVVWYNMRANPAGLIQVVSYHENGGSLILFSSSRVAALFYALIVAVSSFYQWRVV